MRIAHLADLHLGYRAYHRSTPEGRNVREADVAAAFRAAVERTVELEPELVLVAGDVFHSVRPSNAAIADAFRQFSVLRERLPDAPVVLVAGNHDSPRSADTGNILTLFREIPGVHVVCDRPERLHFPELATSVFCIPHNALARDPVEERSEPLEPDVATRLNLLCLHGTVGGSVAEAKLRYVPEFGGATIDPDRIGVHRWDYVALGHYHLATRLAPNMWYAGGIERTSTNVWMEADAPKGFLLFDTDLGVADFQPLPGRPTVDLAPLSASGLGAAEVDARLRSAVEAIPGGVSGKLVRVVVSELPRAVFREMNHRRIREWKAEALHFHLDVRVPETHALAARAHGDRRRTLREEVREFLQGWTPVAAGVESERLVALGDHYLRDAE